MTTTAANLPWTPEDLAKITKLALYRMAYSAPDSELSKDMRDQASTALHVLLKAGDQAGPAAQIRRLAIDAAGARLSARTQRDKASALGRMHAYATALHILATTGIADDGTAPATGTCDDPAWLDELIRFTGPEQAAELGLMLP